jgi:hypothetical protein
LKDLYATSTPSVPERVDLAIGTKLRHSFFKLVKEIWDGKDSFSMHRLCTLMRKMDVTWLVCEDLLEPNEILNKEFEAIKSRCGKDVRCEARRLSFFGDIPELKLKSVEASKSLLAYVIIVKILFPENLSDRVENRTYIFESVVAFPSKDFNRNVRNKENICEPKSNVGLDDFFLNRIPVSNYYYHCGDEFQTTIGTKNDHNDYTIKGTYFAQQNDLTSVCAHVAVQMAINNAPVLGVEKITSEEINHLLGIDHTTPKTRVGHFELDNDSGHGESRSKGLTSLEMVTFAQKLGLGTLFADFLQPPKSHHFFVRLISFLFGPCAVDCYKWLYPQLESCFPTILGIQRPKYKKPDGTEVSEFSHVVTVLGHTMNTDCWEPEARSGYGELAVRPYDSTINWIDHFIVNDDNLGMGRTMSTGQLADSGKRRKKKLLHASMAISLVPKDVVSAGLNPELLGSAIVYFLLSEFREMKNKKIMKPIEWLQILMGSKLIFRTFSSTRECYCNHLRSCEDNFRNKVEDKHLQIIKANMPNRLWITEISVADLFCGNKSKLGDVVGNANFEYVGQINHDLNGLVFLWFPGFAMLGSNPPQNIDWPIKGYIPLQRPTYPQYSQVEW